MGRISDPFSWLSRPATQSGPMLFEDYERERARANPQPAPAKSNQAMIYTLTIKCVWGMYLDEPCTRAIEIKDSANLLDLHEAIQDAVDFDRDHLFEFFVGRDCRNRKILFDESGSSESEADTMSKWTLKRIWPLPEKTKLFYWFDFGDDWKFSISKGRTVRRPTKGEHYPRLVKIIGPNPKQYPDSDFE